MNAGHFGKKKQMVSQSVPSISTRYANEDGDFRSSTITVNSVTGASTSCAEKIALASASSLINALGRRMKVLIEKKASSQPTIVGEVGIEMHTRAVRCNVKWGYRRWDENQRFQRHRRDGTAISHHGR